MSLAAINGSHNGKEENTTALPPANPPAPVPDTPEPGAAV